MSWVEKYKPRNLSEIKLDSSKLRDLKQFVLEKKPVIIYGHTGTGKTCSVYALANEIDYEVIEINATDLRDKDNVNNIIGRSSEQLSLFKSGKILLIDEVDALAGIDRGGGDTILDIINKARTSIILTANDTYDSKLSSIRKKCKLIEFEGVKINDALEVLKKILKKEEIKCKDELLYEIIRQNKGDLRAIINDLQINSIGRNVIEELHISEREKKEDIFKILRTIFKNKKIEENISERMDKDYDELLLWLEENLPKEYYGKSLSEGFNMLSKADIYRKRILKQQYWRFLVYINDFLTKGVSIAKDRMNNRFTSYKRGQRILKYWIAKQKNLKKKEICKKLSKDLHTSSRKLIKDFYFYEKINSKFKIF